MDPHHATHGPYGTYGTAQAIYAKKAGQSAARERPALPAIVGCLFVPWSLFAFNLWVRSFELRKVAPEEAILLSYCILIPSLVFGWMAYKMMSEGSGDPKPMVFILITSLLAWVLAVEVGDWNYNSFMRPFYDINNMNVYPNVEPSKYSGNQMMDAGMINFKKGTRLRIDRSIGFKNKDVYCAAPIVSGTNASQSEFDFWAIGVNCCSGHIPDFHCGEYSNPGAHWGLRLMDASQSDFFNLAVKEATATFNIQAPNPLFFYWLSDPKPEVSAYQDDGYKYFYMAVFTSFGVQLFMVLLGLAIYGSI